MTGAKDDLQEKYSFAVTDTATTDYHFQCDNNFYFFFIILQNIIENSCKAIDVCFSF